jgi:hypothetical protein
MFILVRYDKRQAACSLQAGQRDDEGPAEALDMVP